MKKPWRNTEDIRSTSNARTLLGRSGILRVAQVAVEQSPPVQWGESHVDLPNRLRLPVAGQGP
jgi:hypothetical protein